MPKVDDLIGGRPGVEAGLGPSVRLGRGTGADASSLRYPGNGGTDRRRDPAGTVGVVAHRAVGSRARAATSRAAWLHGRIYPERCDLSPDGRWLAYFTLRA